ncbi:hypothetical protein GGR57DRAFT_474538 [Xylariaceae sp. FL1272]|nr:hypothetical protein GGR57DRAFT_474538 [Xylariaceae sp. FL1272]
MGSEQADRAREKAIVEGTPTGRRVYEKCGMRTEIAEMRFGVGDESAVCEAKVDI